MKTSRQIQAEETKRQILLCYLEMIREKPIDDIKISELCKKANISVGTYYYYYKNKENIIRDIYYHIDNRFDKIYQSLSAKSYTERIQEYLTHTGDEALNYFGLQATTTIYQLQMNVEGDFFMDTTRPFSLNLIKLLTSAIEAGELPAGINIQSTVLELLSIFRGIVYSWCLLKGEFNIVETISTVVAAYMQNLKKPIASK